MSEDAWLIVAVGAVWVALAGLYAFEPMFAMPGGALVWGAGAVIFLALSALIARADGRATGSMRRPRD